MNKALQIEEFQLKKVGIAILVILHVVGIFGYLSPLSDWFLFLTPVNLIITAGMLWIDTQDETYYGWWIAVSIAIMGYVAEIIGVHTGLLFGSYEYGNVLGWKIFKVPPVIGINWLIVIWASFSVAYGLKIPKSIRWIAVALIATGLDYLIEPVAIHYDFWSWDTGKPPLKNFISWFGLACIMAILFERYPIVLKPRLGQVAFICQVVFFGVILYLLPFLK